MIFGSLLLGTSVGDSSCSLTLQNVFDKEAVEKAVSRYDSWAYATRRRGARHLSTKLAMYRSAHGRNSTVLLSNRNSTTSSYSRRKLTLKASMSEKEFKHVGGRGAVPWMEIRPGVLKRQWLGLSAVPQVDLCPEGQMHAFFDKDQVHEAKYFCGQKLMTDRSCRIISIGSNNQWAFERSVFQQTNCSVDTFDCTGKGKGWKVPADISARVRLHSICLDTVEKDDFFTWDHAMRVINVTSPPSWLKIDCEGCERTVLPQLMKAGNDHLLPDQISMEVHFGDVGMTPENIDPRMYRTGENNNKKTFALASMFYKELYAYGGYVLIHRLDNPGRHRAARGCSEVLLARGTCHLDKEKKISGDVSIFNPAVNWLNATEGPCLEYPGETVKRSFLIDGASRQHCMPWNDGGPTFDDYSFCSWQLNDPAARQWRKEHTAECQLKLPSMPHVAIPA